MTKTHRAVVLFLRVVCASSLIGLLVASDAAAQVKDVNVVNQPTVRLAPGTTVAISTLPAVAISGTPTVAISGTPTVAISGTPTVAISGTPTVAISGTPTVAISGTPTVQIANATTNPVLTRDVDRDVQEPVMMSNFFNFPTGGSSVQGSLVLTSHTLFQAAAVPLSKRVVAQFISVDVTVPTGQKVLLAVTSNLGNASMGQAIALGSPQTINGQDVYRTSQPVLVFVQQQATVDVFVERVPAAGNATAIIAMTGYLVNVR